MHHPQPDTNPRQFFKLLAQKPKRKMAALALTPLLAACDGSIFGNASQAPDDAVLIAQGFTIHRSSITADDDYTGTNSRDAIIGAEGDDVFNGVGGDDLIYGNDGDDIIDGGTGSDKIYGGDGDDFISPGTDLATDYIDGGNGTDTISYLNHFGKLNLSLISGEVYINDSLEDEIVNIENVEGVKNATNVIIGDDNNNQLKGGDHADVIEGQGGNDKLYGGGGDDILNGGKGSDALYGGEGNDTFIFSDADIIDGETANDVIYDFETGQDVIDFTGLDFINDFNNVVSNMTQNHNDVEIFVHATDDYIITLKELNVTDLSASDFVFA